MDSIKIYRDVNPENASISFEIKRMEDIYELTKGQADDPHRHDYFIIVIINKAKGKHIIDFHEFEMAGQQVYFISPGQVHQIEELEKSLGWVITFSNQFMIQNGIDRQFIDELHLFQDYGHSPPLELDPDETRELNKLAEAINRHLSATSKFKYQAVGALLKLILIQCNNLCSLEQEENTHKAQAAVTLLRNFKSLLNTNFAEWHKVSQYAAEMAITSDYLNTSVKSLTGKSAKEHIQSRILTAAKRMLLFSGLTNKEIAYELGFSEPANFSQFFKNCTGIAPSKFV